ncbi:hypothetical protein SUGI_1112540 [Cryptomeria japonica]|nr:hypothetical protein SUGI_1112540 [Cryptomeria japonica]
MPSTLCMNGHQRACIALKSICIKDRKLDVGQKEEVVTLIRSGNLLLVFLIGMLMDKDQGLPLHLQGWPGPV